MVIIVTEGLAREDITKVEIRVMVKEELVIAVEKEVLGHEEIMITVKARKVIGRDPIEMITKDMAKVETGREEKVDIIEMMETGNITGTTILLTGIPMTVMIIQKEGDHQDREET